MPYKLREVVACGLVKLTMRERRQGRLLGLCCQVKCRIKSERGTTDGRGVRRKEATAAALAGVRASKRSQAHVLSGRARLSGGR